jgi:hypothetical protein
MKYKVVTKHFVEASSWIAAEELVEKKLTEPDQIESEPADRTPRDYVMFGISSKIFDEHNKIFFDTHINESYEVKVEKLKAQMSNWLDNLLEEVIKGNEENWS